MSDSIAVMIRVSPDLHAWLYAKAKQQDIGVATIARQLLLKARDDDR
jgi:hypothetical protein